MIPTRQAPCKVCDEPCPNVRAAFKEVNRSVKAQIWPAEVLCPRCWAWARRMLETAARIAVLRRGARPHMVSLGLWSDDDVPVYDDVAMHFGKLIDNCHCHPVSCGCCARGLANAILTEANVDAIDSLGFAWHVESPCSPIGFAQSRVVDGQPVRWTR